MFTLKPAISKKTQRFHCHALLNTRIISKFDMLQFQCFIHTLSFKRLRGALNLFR